METGLSVAIVAISGEAFADMSHEKEQTARGLAQIITSSEQCGYSIDQSQLERYFVQAAYQNFKISNFRVRLQPGNSVSKTLISKGMVGPEGLEPPTKRL